MKNSKTNANEEGRLQELRKYEILDTLSEKDYDDITKLASVICDTPISLITFLDEERQWFKSHTGVDVTQTEKEYAFCAHALNDPQNILIVPDSRKDKRFANNPLVTSDPHVIFYTGVPLVTPAGFPLGTLCVIDHKPRNLSQEKLNALTILSNQVMHLLEMRKANIALQNIQKEMELRNIELEQFAYVLSHDIKSPLTSIFLTNSLIEDDYGKEIGEKGKNLLTISNNSAKKIVSLVDGILAYTTGHTKTGQKENIDLTELLESIIPIISANKKIEIIYPKNSPVINMNSVQLEQIFINLLSNSVRYNDKEYPQIEIGFSENKNEYNFFVKDNGIGIDEQDQEKIFTLFTTLVREDAFGKMAMG